MFCFGILRIFREKSQKSKNWKSGHIGLLRRSVGNPRRGVDPHQGVECLSVTRPRCQKGHPSSTPQHRKATPQRSSATPWHIYCSQRAKFWIFVPKV